MSSSATGAHSATRVFIRWCVRACFLLGVIAIAWSSYFWIDAYIYQKTQSRQFEEILKRERVRSERARPVRRLEEPSAEVPAITTAEGPATKTDSLRTPRPTPASILGELAIPRIGLSIMVAEGDSAAILRRAAGHLKSSAMPGENGNIAIAAHRDTFFRSLHDIHKDDIITLTTVTETYRYRVDLIEVVEPENTAVLEDSDGPTLTLITCYPFYYVGPAPRRFIVKARQISPAPAA
jgi:sortase A